MINAQSQTMVDPGEYEGVRYVPSLFLVGLAQRPGTSPSFTQMAGRDNGTLGGNIVAGRAETQHFRRCMLLSLTDFDANRQQSQHPPLCTVVYICLHRTLLVTICAVKAFGTNEGKQGDVKWAQGKAAHINLKQMTPMPSPIPDCYG